MLMHCGLCRVCESGRFQDRLHFISETFTLNKKLTALTWDSEGRGVMKDPKYNAELSIKIEVV